MFALSVLLTWLAVAVPDETTDACLRVVGSDGPATGFLANVSGDIFLITAYHAVHASADVEVFAPGRTEGQIRLSSLLDRENNFLADPDRDLAAFRLSPAAVEQLAGKTWLRRPALLDQGTARPGYIEIVGNPVHNILGTELDKHISPTGAYVNQRGPLAVVLPHGKVLSQKSQVAQNVEVLLIESDNVFHGFSGGPLLYRGQIVGMLIGGDPERRGPTPRKNWAVASSEILKALQTGKLTAYPPTHWRPLVFAKEVRFSRESAPSEFGALMEAARAVAELQQSTDERAGAFATIALLSLSQQDFEEFRLATDRMYAEVTGVGIGKLVALPVASNVYMLQAMLRIDKDGFDAIRLDFLAALPPEFCSAALVSVGLMQVERGNIDDAKLALQSASNWIRNITDPIYKAKAEIRLAELCLKLQDRAQAAGFIKAAIETAQKLTPDLQQVYAEDAARLYTRLDRTEEALALIESRSGEERQMVQRYMARGYAERGDWDAAERILKSLSNPFQQMCLGDLADTALGAKEFTRSEAFALKVFEADTSSGYLIQNYVSHCCDIAKSQWIAKSTTDSEKLLLRTMDRIVKLPRTDLRQANDIVNAVLCIAEAFVSIGNVDAARQGVRMAEQMMQAISTPSWRGLAQLAFLQAALGNREVALETIGRISSETDRTIATLEVGYLLERPTDARGAALNSLKRFRDASKSMEPNVQFHAIMRLAMVPFRLSLPWKHDFALLVP